MSLHKAVADVFNEELSTQFPGIVLTNSDINRIVTNVVQTFSFEKDSKGQVKEQAENYIVRYKQRAGKRDCGCNKK